MLKNNSPTVQRMMESVKPGNGNMNTMTVPDNQGQFQTPYPSPKDMVMQAGMSNQPLFNQPMMPGFQAPQNPVAMINGVPTELVYTPNMESQMQMNIPGGTPMNPNPAPGRFLPYNSNNSAFAQANMTALNNQPNIVGGYNPYSYGMSMPQQQIPQQKSDDFYGVVNMYNGVPIHPNVNSSWYGSPDYPFENKVQASMNQASLSDTMRDRFNQKFPGYSNPYMTTGFIQPQQQNMTPEMIQTANIAAYYGMSYQQFVNNGADMMKRFSRHSSKYLGFSKEEAEAREKTYDPKPISKVGEVPNNDTDLFYPNGAFDWRGQLTREYQSMYCVNQKRLTKVKKTLKVSVIIGDKKIECGSREIDFANSRNKIDGWIQSDFNYNRWLEGNKYRFASMYWNAPERRIDNIQGNVFQVTGKAIGFAEQQDLERKLNYQKYTMSSRMYNKDEFIEKIKQVREVSKENAKKINDAKFSELVHKVSSNIPKDLIPDPYDRPYIQDGDWMIARKPGCDILGMPLDQSVNKIIKLNTATGEEEIYDPGKITGLDIRERIMASMKPSFDQISDDELADRLEKFKNAGFTNGTD